MTNIPLIIIPQPENHPVIYSSTLGKDSRKNLRLDIRDKDDNTYLIVVPYYVVAITASFFLACFARSIRNLGETKFREKYHFDTSNQSIINQVNLGIRTALNTSMDY